MFSDKVGSIADEDVEKNEAKSGQSEEEVPQFGRLLSFKALAHWEDPKQ